MGSIAQRIAARYPQSRMRGQLLPGEFEEWSREGLRVAQRMAYTRAAQRAGAAGLPPQRLEAAEPRVALAGYRLADLLNRSLGS